MRLTQRYANVLYLSLVLIFAIVLSIEADAAQNTNGTYVTTADVKLRKGPGTTYGVLTTIPKNVNVNVVGKEGAWLRIESKHGGKPGYISEQYARPLAAQQIAQAKTSPQSIAGSYRTLRETELREGPAPTSRVITKLPANIKLNVIRSEGDWLRVESKHGGKPGYIERRSVEPWRDR
jgi:N-acetylmuramoyl-L-alanine amidase